MPCLLFLPYSSTGNSDRCTISTLVSSTGNFDGYANSVYTVTIGAVDSRGRMPYYAEECAAMLAVTPSSGSKGKDIVSDVIL